MRRGVGYPLAAIGEAIRATVGQTLATVAIVFLASWLGVLLAGRPFPGLSTALDAVLVATGLFLCPPFCIAWAITWLVWYLSIHYEVVWLRIAAATVVFLTWLLLIWLVTASFTEFALW
jgi:hypothetical protein